MPHVAFPIFGTVASSVTISLHFNTQQGVTSARRKWDAVLVVVVQLRRLRRRLLPLPQRLRSVSQRWIRHDKSATSDAMTTTTMRLPQAVSTAKQWG